MIVRNGKGFSESLVNISLPAFTILFIIAATLGGIYDKRYRPLKAFYATVTAILVMLAAYALLPEKFRFSRGVILLGGFTATIIIIAFRQLLLQLRIIERTDERSRQHQTLVVATEEEFQEVRDLYIKAGLEDRIMGRIAVDGTIKNAISTVEELPSIVNSLQLREIVFCHGYLSYGKIIELLQALPHTISSRFHSSGTTSIVGSDSKNKSGQILSAESKFKINDPYERRMKRILDIVFALVLLLTFPVQLIFCYNSLRNSFYVLLGKKTWVGYSKAHQSLPLIPQAVIPVGRIAETTSAQLTEHTVSKVDFWYAKNYDWKQDVELICKNYKRLGNV
jgi:hypothetical protein